MSSSRIMQDAGAASTGTAARADLWRRAAAFCVDVAAVVALGQVLGLVFADLFAQAGAWGRLIGLGLTLAWFVPFECRLGGGGTPGKRAFGLRLRGARGGAPGPARAAARCAILFVPFFINGAPLPAGLLFGPGVYGVSLLVFGVGGSSLYLFLADRPAHRALHDRLTRTQVLRDGQRQHGRHAETMPDAERPARCRSTCVISCAPGR
jgi:uncharacterized RDD family membrane protein YckC